MEIDKNSSPQFYRQLLHSAKIFLTELDERSQSSLSSDTYSNNQNTFVSQSLKTDSNINTQLKSTRQECHQRLLTCSRKKTSTFVFTRTSSPLSFYFSNFLFVFLE